MVPRVKNYMPHSSAVVVLTRVYVASPRHITLSAACGSFDYRRLPPSSVVAPRTLVLLRAARGGPGLLVPPARSKSKAKRTDVPGTPYDTPCSLFCWPSRRQEIILSSSKTTCDTNRRRVKIVRHVPTVVLRYFIKN